MGWSLVGLLAIAGALAVFLWRVGWAACYRKRAKTRAKLLSYLRRVEAGELGAAGMLASGDRQAVVGRALDDLLPAISASNPFQILCEYVTFYADDFTKYLVLVFSKEELDNAGYNWAAKSPEISGQLRDYLVDWVESSIEASEIRNILREGGASVSHDDALAACRRKFAQACILFAAANVACSPFEPEESCETDWRTPLVYRLAAFHEDNARKAIGLHSLQETKDTTVKVRFDDAQVGERRSLES